MSTLQHWSTVVNKVENANIGHHHIEKQINMINKRAYKQQLDREVEYKQYKNQIKSAQKIQELRQAKSLADQEKLAKLRQKQQSAQLHKLYCNDNRSLLHTKSTTKHEGSNMTTVEQHPFIRLVDGQDNRQLKLRQKFIKQNEINHLQQQMKANQKYKNKHKQWEEKNNFINHVEKTYQRRSQQREQFKNKYLRIRQTEANLEQDNPTQSLEKSYITYLNNQILASNERKKKEKSSVIDDPRLNQFYASDKLEPDSSPAFLGRNPLSHERRRQLYYISKNLGTNHERASTVGLVEDDKAVGVSSGRRMGNDDGRKSMEYVKLAKRLNPEDDSGYLQESHHHARKQQNHSESVHMREHSTANRHYKMQTQTKEKRHYLSSERDPIPNHSFLTQQQASRFHSNKRIKSQLVENLHSNYQPLPDISLQSHQKISNSVKVPVPMSSNQRQSANLKRERRQFFRYDPITGKQVAVFV